MRLIVSLTVVVVAASISTAALARDYRPTSLDACQAKAFATTDDADCYEKELAKLEPRLPAGSEKWKAAMQKSCNTKYERNGTSGIAMSLNCMLQATASKAGVHG